MTTIQLEITTKFLKKLSMKFEEGDRLRHKISGNPGLVAKCEDGLYHITWATNTPLRRELMLEVIKGYSPDVIVDKTINKVRAR